MTDYNTHALKHGYNNYARDTIVYTTTTLLVYMCLLVHCEKDGYCTAVW